MQKIKKIIASLIPLLTLDYALVFADDNAANNDALLAQFQQQLNQVERANPAPVNSAQKPAVANLQATSQSPAVTNANVSDASMAADTTNDDAENSSIPMTVEQYMQKPASANQQAAFDAVTQQAMPMTPNQIKVMKRMMAASQRAAAEPAEVPAKPVTSSLIVNLAPGATPPVIRLSQGFISTLVFVDSSSADWAITAIDNGNPEAFNISWDKKGNTLMIQAKKAYTYGNIAVSLKGLSTPVMLTLVPGQNEIDYRVDLRVSGLAPDSKDLVLMNRLPDSASNQLLSVLDNIPPVGAKTLEISGNGCNGWLANNKIYLRTRFVLLSPGYISVMKSPDGTYAYELQKTPSILVSQFGKPVELRVKGV